MLLRRLGLLGTLVAVASVTAIGVLFALPGRSITNDDRGDGATLAAMSAGLNWQMDARAWMRHATESVTPPEVSVAPVPIEEPPAAPLPVAPVPVDPPVVLPPEEPPPPAPTEPPPTEWLDAAFAAQVLAIINGLRAEGGAPPLVENGSLTAAAGAFSQTLTQLQVLDHGAGGSDLLGRVQANGFTANVQLGEVLWFGTGESTPGNPVDGWMGSPPHHDLIMDPSFAQAGVGCFFRSTGDELQARCVVDLAG